MAQPQSEPELHAVPGGWVAEREGVRVLACCGQEALLRLNIEILARGEQTRIQPPGSPIVEEVQPPFA
jgi:hypothetical protein